MGWAGVASKISRQSDACSAGIAFRDRVDGGIGQLHLIVGHANGEGRDEGREACGVREALEGDAVLSFERRDARGAGRVCLGAVFGAVHAPLFERLGALGMSGILAVRGVCGVQGIGGRCLGGRGRPSACGPGEDREEDDAYDGPAFRHVASLHRGADPRESSALQIRLSPLGRAGEDGRVSTVPMTPGEPVGPGQGAGAGAGSGAVGAVVEPVRLDRQGWLERASLLPPAPGVYLLKDQDCAVVYVGKAKNLRNRVRSYFQERTSDVRGFIRGLASLLGDIETVITRSEKEALLVEREMIRRHAPRFNVIWRDDKQYLCLRVDPTHEYPWVEVVRQMGDDGARYFGPFHSASAARRTLRVVNRHFQLRTCRDAVLYHRTRPCLEYQIGRCPAPCVLEIDRAHYRESVEHVLMFLDGNGKALAKKLEGRMWEASERQDYEVAAHYRDQRDAVERTLERQQVVFSTLSNQDVFGLYREHDALAIAVLEVRRGRVENVSTQLFREPTEGEDDEVLESFLLQRYGAAESPPDEILTPVALRSAAALAEILGEQRGRKVRVLHPKRGDRRALLALAAENAAHGFREQERKTGNTGRALVALKEQLRLTRLPVRIECYDISNFQGAEIVGSRVVFEHGEPKKAAYRRYRVKTTHGQDDFASLYEVLSRRVQRGLEAKDLPDLMVIDGGRGQLNVARAVFRDFGVAEVDLVSLAKSRVVGRDEEDAPVRSSERVFLLDDEAPVVLARGSVELRVLTRLRDEAHRFAISFHRERRGSAGLRSKLEGAPGIGPRRRKALLATLGSLKRIEAASRAQLAEVPGLGRAAADALFRWLHPDSADDPVPSGERVLEPTSGDEAGHTQQDGASEGDA